jgi:hypothetical protein
MEQEKLDKLVEIITSTFDKVCGNISSDTILMNFKEVFYKYFTSNTLYQLFINTELVNVTGSLFEDSYVANNFLALTSEVIILFKLSGIDEKAIIKMIAESRYQLTGETGNALVPVNNLMPVNINKSLEVRESFLLEILEVNTWLVVFYLTVLFLDKTETYREDVIKLIK